MTSFKRQDPAWTPPFFVCQSRVARARLTRHFVSPEGPMSPEPVDRGAASATSPLNGACDNPGFAPFRLRESCVAAANPLHRRLTRHVRDRLPRADSSRTRRQCRAPTPQSRKACPASSTDGWQRRAGTWRPIRPMRSIVIRSGTNGSFSKRPSSCRSSSALVLCKIGKNISLATLRSRTAIRHGGIRRRRAHTWIGRCCYPKGNATPVRPSSQRNPAVERACLPLIRIMRIEPCLSACGSRCGPIVSDARRRRDIVIRLHARHRSAISAHQELHRKEPR
ncbi:hypothetical protein EC912_102201 [Luteibacter rhizovicinus]|uniref:Uncharacterized protein n=1 Tax=Luteibacter rhizovicinus TaxID=242606 RepID=A0A4R3YTS5_9GAMM|nr:hypothetical protein EC912_102201 [Luteibacter rhizovicinus]